MKKKGSIATLAIVLLCVGFYLYSCRNTDLRGWWKVSDDGKTYLVIDDPDGVGNTKYTFNGQPWLHPIGERGEIEPGCHDLGKIEFCVKEGTEYHFDYRGP